MRKDAVLNESGVLTPCPTPPDDLTPSVAIATSALPSLHIPHTAPDVPWAISEPHQMRSDEARRRQHLQQEAERKGGQNNWEEVAVEEEGEQEQLSFS